MGIWVYISESICFLPYPIQLVGFFVRRKLQKKKITERRKKRDEDTFYISTLFLGFIRLLCSEEMSSWTKVASPKQSVEM